MRGRIEYAIHGESNGGIIIVGHGGIFTLTLKDLCPNVDVSWLRITSNNNCSISEVLIHQQDGRIWGELIVWADCSHQHGEAARIVPGALQPSEIEQMVRQHIEN